MNWKHELKRMMKDDDKLLGINANGSLYTNDELGDGLARLDREFDNDYGNDDSEPVCVWTERYIYICTTYDGLKDMCPVPRNPTDSVPWYYGGE